MKTAKIHMNADNQILVIFGQTDKAGEFYVSRAKPSKAYSTMKGAEKAKAAWEKE